MQRLPLRNRGRSRWRPEVRHDGLRRPLGRQLIQDLCRLVRDLAGRELGVLLRHRRARMPEELLHFEQAHATLTSRDAKVPRKV